MTLATAFEKIVSENPGKTAVYWGEQEFTYEQLWRESLAAAARLQGELGVQAGDRVAIWMKNCPEFIPALFGIFLAGGVAVPVNNFLKPPEVAYILADAGAEVLLADDSMAELLPDLKSLRPDLRSVLVESLGKAENLDPEPLLGTRVRPGIPAAFQPVAREITDLAVLVYTSGTTGRPKGAMLSHANLLHNVESCRLVLQCVHEDRMAVFLPMFHSFMLTVGVLLPLLVGGTLILIRSISPLKNFFQEIIQRRATVLPAIPQFYRGMVAAPAIPLPDLRMCISGAAPLPVQTLEEFKAKFSFPLIEGYGLSEASPVVTKNPLNGVRKAGSIGLPIPNVEVSIQDDTGKLLGAGETGEVCVRGGNVMVGYWKQPEETAKVMRGDWLLTGDIGHRDADGYYYITDRKKDMLLVNGINVYPRELEEIIYQYPGIKEVAVIGVPDARRGEQPLAYLVAAEGVTIDERDLLQFVRSKLADYKVPRRVIFLPALPRNATGKVLKTALRELATKAESVAATV